MNELTDIFNEEIILFHGKHRLNSWIRKVQKSNVKCFDTFIKTLKNLKMKFLIILWIDGVVDLLKD